MMGEGLELIVVGLFGVGDDTFIIRSIVSAVVLMGTLFELQQTIFD